MRAFGGNRAFGINIVFNAPNKGFKLQASSCSSKLKRLAAWGVQQVV
jgi:hypothetical protein